MKTAIVVRAFVFVAMILAFQNCAPKGSTSSASLLHISSYNFNSMADVPLVPATDKSDPKCASTASYDVCLFNKNVVAQTGTPISGSIAAGNYLTTQIYGVKLTGLLGTSLDNGTFHLSTLNGKPVTTTSTMKFYAGNDTTTSFAQVQVYYWLNRATEYISGRTGVFQAKGQKLNVVVDDLIGGYSSGTNSIHLRVAASGTPMSWSPELAIHFLGLANLHYATNGAMEQLDLSKNLDCNLRASSCCSSAQGCARAISSGVGDYFAAIVFPNQPTVGETWSNLSTGMAYCGLTRNVDTNASLSATAAYNACPNQLGDTSVMGSVYASIWWRVRKAAIAQWSTTGGLEIDALFMNHLYDLNGSDDFESARQKIILLDNYAFNGKHAQLFQTEFTGRGL